jgi:hypothetical protein
MFVYPTIDAKGKERFQKQTVLSLESISVKILESEIQQHSSGLNEGFQLVPGVGGIRAQGKRLNVR